MSNSSRKNELRNICVQKIYDTAAKIERKKGRPAPSMIGLAVTIDHYLNGNPAPLIEEVIKEIKSPS
jgi:hypothetical protein